MHISDGMATPGTSFVRMLLTAPDLTPRTSERDLTIDRAGGRVVRQRPVRRTVRAPSPPPTLADPRPTWMLIVGIASSASLLVVAMGILSLMGVLALVLLA